MDKTPKIGKNFTTNKPKSGEENTPFLNGLHSPADRARELFKSGLMGKDLRFRLKKKTFRRAILAFLAMFTKPQVVLTGFSKESVTSAVRGSA